MGHNIRNISESKDFFTNSDNPAKKNNQSSKGFFRGQSIALANGEDTIFKSNDSSSPKKIKDHNIKPSVTKNKVSIKNNNAIGQDFESGIHSCSKEVLDKKYKTTPNKENRKQMAVIPKPSKDEVFYDCLVDENGNCEVYSFPIKSKHKLTESKIHKKVKKMLMSCKNKGKVFVIYYPLVEKNALLVWDSVNKKPVYTTFDSKEIQVFTESDLQALRNDMINFCDSESCSKNEFVKLEGLNEQIIIKKVRELKSSTSKDQINDGPRYIAELLKTCFPKQQFSNDNVNQNSKDTNELALEIKKTIKEQRKKTGKNKMTAVQEIQEIKSTQGEVNPVVEEGEVPKRKIILPNGEVIVTPVRLSSYKY